MTRKGVLRLVGRSGLALVVLGALSGVALWTLQRRAEGIGWVQATNLVGAVAGAVTVLFLGYALRRWPRASEAKKKMPWWSLLAWGSAWAVSALVFFLVPSMPAFDQFLTSSTGERLITALIAVALLTAVAMFGIALITAAVRERKGQRQPKG